MSDITAYGDARERIDRIKAHVSAAWSDIVEAYRNRDWITLGYADWDTLCAEEFGGARIALPIEDRRAVVADLRGSGMSMPAIASAVGASVGTIHADLSTLKGSDLPDTVTGLDGRQRPATQPAKVTTTSRTTEATKVERNVDMATGEILDGQIPATEDRRPPAAPPVIPITEEQAEALDSLLADPSVRNSNLRKRFAAWIASINQAHLFDPAEMARIYPDAEEALTRNVTGMADFLATYKASTQSNRRIRLVKEA